MMTKENKRYGRTIFRAREAYGRALFFSDWSESLEDAKRYEPVGDGKNVIIEVAALHRCADGTWLPSNCFTLKF